MESKVKKWGNSNAIRIPKVFLDALDLKENDLVSIKKDDDRLIITKIKKERITLKERISKFKGTYPSEEFVWDDPVGKEIW